MLPPVGRNWQLIYHVIMTVTVTGKLQHSKQANVIRTSVAMLNGVTPIFSFVF